MDYLKHYCDLYDLIRKITKQMINSTNYEYQCNYKREVLNNIYQYYIKIINKLIYNYDSKYDHDLYYDFIISVFNSKYRNNFFGKLQKYNIYLLLFLTITEEELKKLYSLSKNLKKSNLENSEIVDLKIKIIKVIGKILFKLTKLFLLTNIYQCNISHNCFYNYPIFFIQPPEFYYRECYLKYFKKKLLKIIDENKIEIKPKIIFDLSYFNKDIWDQNDDIKYNIINIYKELFSICDFYLVKDKIKINEKSILLGIKEINKEDLRWIFQKL